MKRIFLIAFLFALTSISFSQTTPQNYDAQLDATPSSCSTDGAILTNLVVSGAVSTAVCNGTCSYVSLNAGIKNFYNTATNTRKYVIESGQQNLAGTSQLLSASIWYKIHFDASVSNKNWHIRMEVIQGGVSIGTLKSIDSTGSTVATSFPNDPGGCTYLLYDPSVDGYFNIPAGATSIRVTAWAETTANSPLNTNFISFDDFNVGIYSPLGLQGSATGLTQPSYTANSSNITRYANHKITGKAVLNKSPQTSTSCSGSGSLSPLCATTSVKGWYEIRKYDTTGTYVSTVSDSVTVPYQSGSYHYENSNAVFRDSLNNTYEHWFTIPTVNSTGDGYNAVSYQAVQASDSAYVGIYPYSISRFTYTSSSAVCSATGLIPKKQYYCSSSVLDNGYYLYIDADLTTPVASTGSNWVLYDNGVCRYAFKIDSNGMITNYTACSIGCII